MLQRSYWRRTIWIGCCVVLSATLAGCTNQYGGTVAEADDPHFKRFRFVSDPETNTEIPQSPAEIELYNLDGEKVPLSDYIGKKTTILVVTRGNTIPICPFCSTQTSRYVMYYPRFTRMDVEVLLVYPIESEFTREGVDHFLDQSQEVHGWNEEQSKLPILVDTELTLVDYLGIRQDLSKPSTYVFDESGEITFAYVGHSISDRPSITAMIEHVESLQKNKEEKKTSQKENEQQPELSGEKATEADPEEEP